MWSRMNPNQKLKFAVVGNYHLAKGLSQFFEDELGMTPTIKLCSHSLKTVNEPDETIDIVKMKQSKFSNWNRWKIPLLLQMVFHCM